MNTHWTLVASHGAVLFYLATHEQATMREVAHDIELTERRVSQIIRDLANSNILRVERRGRRNAYEVNAAAAFDNPMREVSLGAVVDLVKNAQRDREVA